MELSNNMFAEFPDVVTREQLQEMLHIGKSKAYSLLRTGTIKSKKVGTKGYRIKKVNVIKYLEED